jgi:hypothetical protein
MCSQGQTAKAEDRDHGCDEQIQMREREKPGARQGHDAAAHGEEVRAPSDIGMSQSEDHPRQGKPHEHLAEVRAAEVERRPNEGQRDAHDRNRQQGKGDWNEHHGANADKESERGRPTHTIGDRDHMPR